MAQFRSMARLPRVVLSHIPHHVTQRGKGLVRTFFDDADYRLYRALLADHGRQHGGGIWGWCLMPNHVHLILTPSDKDGLRAVLSRVHRQYAGHVHAREQRTGHFWQGPFGCVTMDEAHLVATMAYVVLNPPADTAGGTGTGLALVIYPDRGGPCRGKAGNRQAPHYRTALCTARVYMKPVDRAKASRTEESDAEKPHVRNGAGAPGNRCSYGGELTRPRLVSMDVTNEKR